MWKDFFLQGSKREVMKVDPVVIDADNMVILYCYDVKIKLGQGQTFKTNLSEAKGF